MQRIPDLGKERIYLGPGPVVPALPLAFRAPVSAFQYQTRTGFKGMPEGAAERQPALPVALCHGIAQALSAAERCRAFHVLQRQLRFRFAFIVSMINGDYLVPVRTTALLTLPEKEGTLELGSGSYHYEYETDTRLEQERYHLDVPLSVMLNHRAAKPLLQQYMPEMLDNPMLEYMVKNPISTILSYAPQVKPLFEMILKAMNDSEI